ncbi:MAG TPA: MerR family transcriptional regulator [Tepidisphaeraceae bacterium]|jgi:DNA-binding transcriptional MerR regulator|nr:MerR family transcriptional regulator [Tepidisphaeraceae bacterium]
MSSGELGISELADAAGLSRRAVRFYVQQGLLPPPNGKGRGSHYDAVHLGRLKKILELQQAGHSLDAIRRILDGQPVEIPKSSARRAPRAMLSAELWTRLRLMEGVELHFDTARHNPEVEKLMALREFVREVFGQDQDE